MHLIERIYLPLQLVGRWANSHCVWSWSLTSFLREFKLNLIQRTNRRHDS